MTQHEYKQFGGFEVKDESLGLVEAVVLSLGVVDADRDVVLPGAIKEGSTVKISSYGHDILLAGAAPVGLGTVSVIGNRAILKGQFFMNTERGREAFETVRSLGRHGQWSTGFKVAKTAPMTPEWRAQGAERLISEMLLVESSPVFMGASPNTTTLAVKSTDEQREIAALAREHERRELRLIKDHVDTRAREVAALAQKDEIRELRRIRHNLHFAPERADHLVPPLTLRRLKELAHVACTYLTRGPVDVRYYEQRSWQKHCGFFSTSEPNTVWVALGPERDMQLTLCHEIAHAAGYSSEVDAERNAETIVAIWESLKHAA